MREAGTYEYDEAFAESLFQEFNKSYSDKGSFHQYHRPYSHLLASRNISSFLEVGLFLNELPHTDLYAWSATFPQANIFGADIKQDLLFASGNISTFYVDQNDVNSLASLADMIPGTLDVVLDDASHFFSSTVRTFEALYPKVSTNGVYLIEDVLNSSSNEGWQQTVAQLSQYFTDNNLTFEVFEACPSTQIVTSEDGEETTEPHEHDSYIFAIYK